MNRGDLQQLADERARDADALLAAGRWSAAYYLAGYAVECALKACIAKRTQQYDFPDRDIALKCYTHKIEELVLHAQLKGQRDAATTANAALANNWLTAGGWTEHARYKLWTEADARKLVGAVIDPVDGVLTWLKTYW